ncbi:hypothetical protein AC15_3994 [Escherichia coli 2-156-04_S3_C2]|nr:hypothetical protein AC15_3994 [Escherichia coli 2-156-04_S3_C2]
MRQSLFIRRLLKVALLFSDKKACQMAGFLITTLLLQQRNIRNSQE